MHSMSYNFQGFLFDGPILADASGNLGRLSNF